jgi:TatA/E family protein of Tat protein translocase
MSTIGARELIVLLIVVVILFGAKRLPDTARSLGQSLRILKKEMKNDGEDSQPGDSK